MEVEQLSVSYGKTAALRGASLCAYEGEIVALIGPNGAGKTTLLHAITGLVRPTAGYITFRGKALVGLRPEMVAQSGVSLVPEGRHIFTTLTVAENLRLGCRPRDWQGQETAEPALARFPALRGLYSTLAGKLSGGEQQQLAIGRALLAKPAVLMLDEPSLGLAPQIVDAIFAVIADLRDEGTTIVLVEQHAERAMHLADRTYILGRGQVVASGTYESLQGQGDLIEVYLGG